MDENLRHFSLFAVCNVKNDFLMKICVFCVFLVENNETLSCIKFKKIRNLAFYVFFVQEKQLTGKEKYSHCQWNRCQLHDSFDDLEDFGDTFTIKALSKFSEILKF